MEPTVTISLKEYEELIAIKKAKKLVYIDFFKLIYTDSSAEEKIADEFDNVTRKLQAIYFKLYNYTNELTGDEYKLIKWPLNRNKVIDRINIIKSEIFK